MSSVRAFLLVGLLNCLVQFDIRVLANQSHIDIHAHAHTHHAHTHKHAHTVGRGNGAQSMGI